MNKYENSVMMNVESESLQSFVAVSSPELTERLQHAGWALVLFKEFQYRLVGSRLEVQVSRVLEGDTYGRYQLYNSVTAAKLAASQDAVELAQGARALFGAFSSDDRVFWHHDLTVATSTRTCGVFRSVQEFSPSGLNDDYVVTLDLESCRQMRRIHSALESGCLYYMPYPLYKVERHLVFQIACALEPVLTR